MWSRDEKWMIEMEVGKILFEVSEFEASEKGLDRDVVVRVFGMVLRTLVNERPLDLC